MSENREVLEALDECLWHKPYEEGITQKKWLEDELTHGSASDAYYEVIQAFKAGYFAAKSEEES